MNTIPADASLFAAIPRGKISNIIIERITGAVADGALNPGDRIPTEQEFSTQLGVGRNVVREAIKVLEAYGVVEIRRADGTYITDGYNPKLLNPLFYSMILSGCPAEELIRYRASILYPTLFLIMRSATDEELEELYLYSLELYNDVTAAAPRPEWLLDRMREYISRRGALAHNRIMSQLDGMTARLSDRLLEDALKNALEADGCRKLMDDLLYEANMLRERAVSRLGDCLEQRVTIWMELLKSAEKAEDQK